MRLRYFATFSYARKVVATPIGTGLEGKIEKIPTNPWDSNTDIPNKNLVGKALTLQIGNGDILFDLPVICEFLNGLHDGDKLFPTSGGFQWTVFRVHALAAYILEASVLCLVDGKRPKELTSQDWVEWKRKVFNRSLDALEPLIPELDCWELTTVDPGLTARSVFLKSDTGHFSWPACNGKGEVCGRHGPH